MENNTENIEYKQNYLRKEIIDKGYNQDEFTEYIKSKKGENGINLEYITFSTLKEIVEDFQNQPNLTLNINNEYNSNNLSNSYTLFQNNKNEIEEKETKEEENTLLEKENIIKELNIEDLNIEKKYITCNRQEKNAFTEMEDLIIIITSPEYIKKSLFSFSYYQYSLIIPKFNIECIRTYSDFEYLNEKLKLLYPLIIFPPFPENSFFDKNSTENVNKKVRKLNLYINSLSQNMLIRSNQLFQDFLLLPYEKFQKKKKEYNNLIKPKKIDDLYTLNGNLEITIHEKKDDFCCNINSNIQIRTNLLEKLDKYFNELISIFHNISDKMNNISDTFQQLSNAYFFTFDSNMNKNFYKFSHIFNEFKKFYFNQEIYYQEELREDFKYMYNELLSFNQLNEQFNEGRNDFLESKNLVDSGEVIIGEEFEKEFKIKKINYGFILNRYYDEYQRINIMHQNKLKNLFNNFVERNNKMVNNYMKLELIN